MFIKFDRSPLVVEVCDGRWDAYAQHTPPNARDRQLLKIIKDLGGISPSNSDGRYHFNAKVHPFKKKNLEVTLTKIEE